MFKSDKTNVLEDNSEFYENGSNYYGIINSSNMFLMLKDRMSVNESPEEDFRDTFLIRNQYKLSKALLMQLNNEESKIDRSEYVYFNQMPYIYPFKNNKAKDSKNKGKSTMLEEYSLKHLDLNMVMSSSFSLKSVTQNFVKKFLEKSIKIISPGEVVGLELYSTKEGNDYIIENSLMSEAQNNLEVFFNKVLQEEQLNHNETNLIELDPKNLTKKERELMDNQNFIYMKQQEINKVLNRSVNESLNFCGLIKFPSYEDKLKFLKSEMRVFGLHVLDQKVNFFDADFCNVLEFEINQSTDSSEYTSFNSEIVTLSEIMNEINLCLRLREFDGPLLEIPNYVMQTDMQSHQVEFGVKGVIRLNSFSQMMQFYDTIKTSSLSKALTLTLKKPEVTYYNDYFISSIDLIIRNTIEDFDSILSVKSDYSF